MRHQRSTISGAVGLLSIILVTAVVLVFSLTISMQVLLNMKNAKLIGDFSGLYYVTEGGLRDARIQLKKEDSLSKDFLPITIGGSTINRAATIPLVNITVTATGTSPLMNRIVQSVCGRSMEGCATEELTP